MSIEIREGVSKEDAKLTLKEIKTNGSLHQWLNEKEVELLIDALKLIIPQIDCPVIPANLAERKYEITAINHILLTLKVENDEEVEINFEY